MSGWNLLARAEAAGLNLTPEERAKFAHRMRIARSRQGINERQAQRVRSDPSPAVCFRNPRRRNGSPSRRRASGAHVSASTGWGQKHRRRGTFMERIPHSSRETTKTLKALLAERKALRAETPENRAERRLLRVKLHQNKVALAEAGYRD